MHLSDEVKLIFSKINAAGYRADIVGGPVRDFLRGVVPNDYDITTDATPDEVKRIFSRYRTVDTGIKHGTVTLVLDGGCYEITTYRIDGEYKDSRHPESVSFTPKIEEDLARRDFTMNAIAYNERDGITDLYGGADDISKRIIRAVRDPRLRFSEDALRILRAIRFSATLGFEIEENTRLAIFEKKHLLSDISRERVFCELKKTLAGEYAYSVIEEYGEVILPFMSGLRSLRLPEKSLFDACEWDTRLMAIYYLSSDSPAKDFVNMSKSLKTDAALRERGKILLSALDEYSLTEHGTKDALLAIGKDNLSELIKLSRVLGRDTKAAENSLSEILSMKLPYKLSELKIAGDDLIGLGFSGREVGGELSRLLREALFLRVENEKGALLALAREDKSRNLT